LAEALSRQGWGVVRRDREGLEWWADEVWTVESEWAPRGFTVFLTWLVDPQRDEHGEPRPGEFVWGVGTSFQRPADRLEAEGHPLMGTNRWPRDLPRFLAGLSKLRHQHLLPRSG
jgi:hypothetical protein